MEQQEMAQESLAEQICYEQYQLCPSPQVSPGGVGEDHTCGPLSSGLHDPAAGHAVVQHTAPKPSHQAHSRHGGSSRKHRRDGGGHRVHTKKGVWTEEEEMVLAEHHREIGNKWAAIAKFLPLRTDNDVKNHWNSTLRSKSAVKHTSFLWLYAKEVEYVADSETARCRSFDHALHMYEELRAHSQASAEQQADGSSQPDFMQTQQQQQQQAWLRVADESDAAVLHDVPPVTVVPAAARHGCTGAWQVAPASTRPAQQVQQDFAAAEADTEDSQSPDTAEPTAAAATCMGSHALCSPAAQHTAGEPFSSNPGPLAPAAYGRAVGDFSSMPRDAQPSTAWGMGSMVTADNDGDATDSEGLLLVMPSTSPAPCSLNELSEDLALQDVSDLVHDPHGEASSCPSGVPSHVPWQANNSFMATSRDGSDSPSNSRAPTAAWGAEQVPAPCRQQRQQHAKAYPTGLAPGVSTTFRSFSSHLASPSSWRFVVSGAASPSPPPHAATSAGVQVGKWLLTSNDYGGADGLPPGLSMDVIAMDLQDHTFDNLDVTTFLRQSSTNNNHNSKSPAAGIGCSTGSSVSKLPVPNVVGEASDAQPFRWPRANPGQDLTCSQQQGGCMGLGSHLDHAQPAEQMARIMHAEQAMDNDEEMLPCSRLLAATPQPGPTSAVPLLADPLELSSLPACNTGARSDRPLTSAGVPLEEPASSRSLSASTCTATPVHGASRPKHQASPFMQASYGDLLQPQPTCSSPQHYTALRWPQPAAPSSPAAEAAVLEVPAVGKGPWDTDAGTASIPHNAGMCSATTCAAPFVLDGVAAAAGPVSNSCSPSRNGSNSPTPSPWVASSVRPMAPASAKLLAPAAGPSSARSWSQQLQQVQQLFRQAPGFKACVAADEQPNLMMGTMEPLAGAGDWGGAYALKGRVLKDAHQRGQAAQSMFHGHTPMAGWPESPTSASHCGKRKSDDFAVARPVGAGSTRFVRSCYNKASGPQAHARFSLDAALGTSSQTCEHDSRYLATSEARGCWAKPSSPTAATCLPPGNHSFSTGLPGHASAGIMSRACYPVHSIQEGEVPTESAFFGTYYTHEADDPGSAAYYNKTDLGLSVLAAHHLSLRGSEERHRSSAAGHADYQGTRVIIHKPPASMGK